VHDDLEVRDCVSADGGHSMGVTGVALEVLDLQRRKLSMGASFRSFFWSLGFVALAVTFFEYFA
jgi:hypothetical protein